jgi:hypothetical protein
VVPGHGQHQVGAVGKFGRERPAAEALRAPAQLPERQSARRGDRLTGLRLDARADDLDLGELGAVTQRLASPGGCQPFSDGGPAQVAGAHEQDLHAATVGSGAVPRAPSGDRGDPSG